MDAISSQMTLDKETTWQQRPHFEGPLSGRLRHVSLYLRTHVCVVCVVCVVCAALFMSSGVHLCVQE